MAAGTPAQLVQHVVATEDITLDDAGIKFLQSIPPDCKLKILGVVGPYRSGKSFLLNRFLGLPQGSGAQGFALGHETDGKTRGIHIWGRVDPKDASTWEICLDCEGLLDPANEGKKAVDMKLFLILSFLSSNLLINSKGTIDSEQMEHLGAVVQVTKNINPGAHTNISQPPQLTWVVRDFTLQQKLSGKVCTGKEYLEHNLDQLKKNPKLSEAVDLIRESYPDREGHFMPFPVFNPSEDLVNIEGIPESGLNPKYKEKESILFNELRSHRLPVKHVSGQIFQVANVGVPLTAKVLIHFLPILVNSVNSSKEVHIPNLLETFYNQMCQETYNAARASYITAMNKIVPTFPLDDSSFQAAHDQAYNTARKEVNVKMKELPSLFIVELLQHLENEVISSSGDQDDDGPRKLKQHYHQENNRASQLFAEAFVAKVVADFEKASKAKQFNAIEAFLEFFEKSVQDYETTVRGPYKQDGLQQLMSKLADMRKTTLAAIQLDEREKQLKQQRLQQQQLQEDNNKLKQEVAKAHQQMQRQQQESTESIKKIQEDNRRVSDHAVRELERANTRANELEQARLQAQAQVQALTTQLQYGLALSTVNYGSGGGGGRATYDDDDGGGGRTWVRPHTRNTANGPVHVRGYWRN